MGDICRRIIVMVLIISLVISHVDFLVFAGQRTEKVSVEKQSDGSVTMMEPSPKKEVHADDKKTGTIRKDTILGRKKDQAKKVQAVQKTAAAGKQSAKENIMKTLGDSGKKEEEAPEGESAIKPENPEEKTAIKPENPERETAIKPEEPETETAMKPEESPEQGTGEKGEDIAQPGNPKEDSQITHTGNKEDKDVLENEKKDTSKNEIDFPSRKEQESRQAKEERISRRNVAAEEDMMIQPFSTLGPHDTPMPKITRQYFTLQKNSKKAAEASGKNLKVVDGEKSGYQYIAKNYGDAYNFTPRFTGSTKVKTGGGNGGSVSLDKVKASSRDVYGDIYTAVGNGTIQTKVYNLDKCTVDPYAIYSNVGIWYDIRNGKSYNIDMKITVTGYLFPGKNIRSQLNNDKLEAPFVGFSNNRIGLVVMGTDYIETKMEFYYSGTQTPVSGIKGVIQFVDIDAQQGTEFGTGFQKVLMFKVGGTHLQYTGKGLMSNSLGYVSSRTKENLSAADKKQTTALGIFENPAVKCRWTVAKCDHKDTGGNGTAADYYAPGGYGVPADSSQSDATSYYYSNSTGFICIASEVGIHPLPAGVKKNLYAGKTDKGQSESKDTALVLKDRTEIFTYVLSAAAVSGDPGLSAYSKFTFSDTVSEYLNVRKVKVYADKPINTSSDEKIYSDATSWFKVTTAVTQSHQTKVTAAATADVRGKAGFYGRTYYLHIEVELKANKELADIGLSIEKLYQTDDTIGTKVPDTGDYTGKYAVDNQGRLGASTSIGNTGTYISNYVASVIPMRLAVRKIDKQSGKPVAGVVFGLFGGADVKDTGGKKPLYTAVTDKEGVAVFESGKEHSFYRSAFGEGPYCIKEISVPEIYHSVWNVSVMEQWVYTIGSLRSDKVLAEEKILSKDVENTAVLTNHNNFVKEKSLRIYKQSRDEGAYLKGAEFVLYEWSQTAEKYLEKMSLVQETQEDGKVYYTNKEKLVNTMDNLGKYKIIEKKAPQGCVLTGEEWIFSVTEETAQDGNNIVYINNKTGKKQSGELYYKNPLQKGVLTIVKKDDEGSLVEGASFLVTAAEDIYAPWDMDDEGKPNKDAEPLTAKGTIVDSIKTGAYGRGTSTKGNELYIGSYMIKETVGAKDHIPTQKEYEVNFEYNADQTVSFVQAQIEVSNEKMRPSLAVAKLADRTRDMAGGDVGFSEQTGRFLEEKAAGTYQAEETVRYTITVTNTGNVELFHVTLTDDMNSVSDLCGNSLAAYLDIETAAFIVPKNGIFTTRKGEKIRGTIAEDTNLAMSFDHLAEGDSVSVILEAQIKEEAANAFLLENDVYASAQYDDHGEDPRDRHLVPVPTENLVDADGSSLVMDKDYINIPGIPEDYLVKTADKTSGIAIKDGEVLPGGFKIPGAYREGEQIVFRILVKNTGTANLKNIQVKDIMSDELKAVVDEKNASFCLGETGETETMLLTAKGRKISARLISASEVQLCYKGSETKQEDRLLSGDYIELFYYARVLKDAANLYDLENTAYLNAQYYNGKEDIPLKEQVDKDYLAIPGVPEGETAKLANKTTGVYLEDGRYVGTKITGTYGNGEQVIYTITVSNIGTAVLYNLTLEDVMSKELKEALVENSISFKEGIYKTALKKNVRTWKEDRDRLVLDVLVPGDSVKVKLTANVRKDTGNLFELENVVNLTARFKQGNEKLRMEAEKAEEEAQRTFTLTYVSNNKENKQKRDTESPCMSGTRIHLNGNDFVWEGYDFLEWNTKADGSGDSYKPDEIFKMDSGDVVLYAQWKKVGDFSDGREIPSYRLIYHSNNKKNQQEADEENAMFSGYKMTVNYNHFCYPGFQFAGWNTKPDGSGKMFVPGSYYQMPQKDVILYAQWKKEPSYRLIYHANNGSDINYKDAETPCSKGGRIQVDGNPYTCEKDGNRCAFLGWNTKPDGSGQTYMPGNIYTVQSDTNLYGQWKITDKEEKTYLLIYRANNETADWTVDEESPVKEEQQLIVNTNRFFYEGYDFIGWNTKPDGSGKDYNPGMSISMPSKQITLYAQWKQKDAATLTYHSNTEKPDSLVDAETPEEELGVITVDGNAFVNKGQIFTGWNTKADGSGKAYRPADFYTLSEKDNHLYAQWTKAVQRYVLLYSSNYPDGSPEEVESDSEAPCFEGTVVKINRSYFKVDGYRFAGWNSTADGKGKSYLPSYLYQMSSEDVTLYAQWEKLPDNAGEAGDVNNPGNSDHLETVKDPNLPSAKEEAEKAIQKAYDDIKRKTIEQAAGEAEQYDSIPVTEKMTDKDHINIPGSPSAKAAKLADRTEDAVLREGRYQGTKTPGTYEYQEKVDYTITVTNSGTADLYNIIVTDIMDKKLQNVIETSSVVFKKGKYITLNGSTINAAEEKAASGKSILHLDYLAAGDAVNLHLSAKIKTGAAALKKLNNKVTIRAEYQSGKDIFTEIPKTPQMTDEDKINVGAPSLAIMKAVGKISSSTLIKGRYHGIKKRFAFKQGDKVNFTIIVTNTGTGAAYHVEITDTPTKNLRDQLDIAGFSLSGKGTMQTEKGQKISVLSTSKNKVIFDKLQPGDSIALQYSARIKSDAKKGTGFTNNVEVTGKNIDKTSISETKFMKDYDKLDIKIPAPDKKKQASPKTGDNTPVEPYVMIIILSTILMAALIYYKKKNRRKRHRE